MDGLYEIQMGGQAVGKARVTRQGLYYHFDCRCRLSGQVICRLVAQSGDKTENLGIPVPCGKEFVLQKLVAAGKLGNGCLEIRVVPKGVALDSSFIPLKPEEPFAYIARLKNACLQRKNGQLGILLREETKEIF
ncbi:MAG: hypothetical protein E7439_05920 [Ruminococcaceae bacterium]|nr:hypothetical protein [Oscillospiraceae bacterium]